MNGTAMESRIGKILIVALASCGLLLSAASFSKADDRRWGEAVREQIQNQHDKAPRERHEERYDKRYDKGYDKRYDKGYDKRYDKRHTERQPDHRKNVRVETVVRELPRSSKRVVINRNIYYRDRDNFYLRHNHGYTRVRPPVGVVVASLPNGYFSLTLGGQIHFRSGDVYYRPTRGGYLVVNAPLVATVPAPPLPPADAVVVSATLLNVRSGPGQAFAVIDMVRYGEVLPVRGAAPGWHCIELPDGRIGWVMSSYTVTTAAG